MADPRIRKIADGIEVIVAEMFERRIKDPRLGFVTVYDVRRHRRPQQATVFYTVLGDADRPRRDGGGAGVGHGPDPPRGRQAARNAARAHADLRPGRPPRERASPRRAAAGPRPLRRGRGRAPARRTPATTTPTASRGSRTTRPTRTRARPDHGEAGLVVVDKPGGMTSHDVVARVRRLAGTRKVGHAGTLDPMATGVLVLGVNRATRLLGHLMLTDKAYDATIRLGVATTTDDAEGEVAATASTDDSTEAAVGAALAAHVGEIEQVPSRRLRDQGRRTRAYDRVRAGEEVELAARRVTVHAIDVTTSARTGDARRRRRPCAAPAAPTSARSRATLGAALGVGGHLTSLRRTAVGPFTLEAAHTLDALAEPFALVPIAEAARACFPSSTWRRSRPSTCASGAGSTWRWPRRPGRGVRPRRRVPRAVRAARRPAPPGGRRLRLTRAR